MVLLLTSFFNLDLRNAVIMLYVVLVIATIFVIIKDNRDPVKSLAWITVISTLPVFGIIMYVFFGRNHRKQKIFDLKEIKDLEQFEYLSHKQLTSLSDPNVILRKDIEDNRDIITLLLNNSKSLLTMRNRITVLNNGKETFSSIFESLRCAKSFIHLEYYIFEDDRLGRRITTILKEKVKEGVKVRLIYDDVGSWGLSSSFVKDLRESGIEVSCFMPVFFPWLTSKINYRNHRKIIIVDGKIAYTGGINIAERYLKRGRQGIWRDTHLKLEGESVGMLQAIFITDWYFSGDGELLSDKEVYFPTTDITEESPVQIASSGPDSDWSSIMQAFFAAIARAQDHIYISTPYFLPNQAIMTALKVAALSGIDVRLMIPYRSDSKIVYWATRSYISDLLNAGIKVYFYRKGFNHSKLIMIDSRFSSVGTANMDIRSFETNFEVSALMYDSKIAVELETYFLQDLNHSKLVTRDMWDSRPRLHRMYESLSRLLSPLL